MLGHRFFKRNTPVEQNGSDTPVHIGKWVVRGIFALVITGAIVTGLFVIGSSIANSWQEVWFAYNHPAIVKSVRLEYTQRQQALDQEFTTSNPDNMFLKEVKTAVSQQVQQSLNFK